MSKVRNLFFSLVCLVLFCAVAFYVVADEVGVVPEAIVSDTKRAATFEGKQIQKIPKVSLSAIVKGSFQKQAEAFLTGRFPLRLTALLTNAAAQRSLVHLSSTGFGFDVYPTFFGSRIVYSKRYDALYEMPTEKSAGIISSMRSLAGAIDDLAKEDESLNIVTYLPDRAFCTSWNPVLPYVGNPIRKSDFVANYLDIIAQDSTALTAEYASADEWRKDYTVTDHHWNIRGGYRAYAAIAEAFGLEALEPKGLIRLPQDFSGSSSRTGLYWRPDWEHIEDMDFDYPEWDTIRNEKSFRRNNKRSYIDGEGSFIRSYSHYFGQEQEVPIHYSVPSNEGAEKLLVVCDSYGTMIEPMLASHYRETHVIYPLELDEEYQGGKLNIREYLAQNEIKNVVVVLTSAALLSKATMDFFGGSGG